MTATVCGMFMLSSDLGAVKAIFQVKTFPASQM